MRRRVLEDDRLIRAEWNELGVDAHARAGAHLHAGARASDHAAPGRLLGREHDLAHPHRRCGAVRSEHQVLAGEAQLDFAVAGAQGLRLERDQLGRRQDRHGIDDCRHLPVGILHLVAVVARGQRRPRQLELEQRLVAPRERDLDRRLEHGHAGDVMRAPQAGGRQPELRLVEQVGHLWRESRAGQAQLRRLRGGLRAHRGRQDRVDARGRRAGLAGRQQ
jgi:hypothetical protein